MEEFLVVKDFCSKSSVASVGWRSFLERLMRLFWLDFIFFKNSSFYWNNSRFLSNFL